MSTLLPRNTTSIILNSAPYNPLLQLQQFAVNRSEVSSPTLAKSSRLSNMGGLKMIRETKRETNFDDNRSSLASSNVSYLNKEN